MKKMVSFILIFSIILSLYASAYAETKDVESLMLAADQQEESISAAMKAYNALSDAEKEDISDKAKESLYKARLYNLANKVASLGNSALFLTDAFATAWENVGTDNVVDYVGFTKYFPNSELTVSEYVDLISTIRGKPTTEKEVLTMLWAIAWALYPRALVMKNGIPVPNEWVSEKMQQDTIVICGKYNDELKFVQKYKEIIPEEVREFRSEYKTQYPDEVSTLNDMLIETNIFVNLALNPKGNLVSYKKEIEDYRDKVERFLITMDAYY